MPDFHQAILVVTIMDPWTRSGRGSRTYLEGQTFAYHAGHVPHQPLAACVGMAAAAASANSNTSTRNAWSRKLCPERPARVVEMLELQGRVRWYREQGYDRTSIEAKVRHRGSGTASSSMPEGGWRMWRWGEPANRACGCLEADISTAYRQPGAVPGAEIAGAHGPTGGGETAPAWGTAKMSLPATS